jgi:hypothetical protein
MANEPEAVLPDGTPPAPSLRASPLNGVRSSRISKKQKVFEIPEVLMKAETSSTREMFRMGLVRWRVQVLEFTNEAVFLYAESAYTMYGAI